MNRTPYGRHFCTSCHVRVFPGDTLETLTEAPKLGAHGTPILLSSENSKRRSNGLALTAWCWSEGKWVETYRKDRFDLEVEYARRAGVTFHFNGQVGAVGSRIAAKQFASKLDQRLEMMRGAAMIETQKRPKLRVVKRRRSA